MRTGMLGIVVVVALQVGITSPSNAQFVQGKIISQHRDSAGYTHWRVKTASGVHKTGTSYTRYGRTMYSGPAFRGKDSESILFADSAFAERFPEGAWLDAIEDRNVAAMTEAAWQLKMVETVLGKTDKKTTSGLMFDAAARVAVEQANESALNDIVALHPESKQYKEEIKAMGKTRGVADSLISMPEVVYPSPMPAEEPSGAAVKQYIEELTKRIAPHQTPHLYPEIVHFGFRGMPVMAAENVAILANRGRLTNDPKLLALAAMTLAENEATEDVAFLNPASMLNEAANLAIALEDKDSLSYVIDVYRRAKIGADAEKKVQALTEELKAMSATRGAPSPKDAFKELVTPWYILVHQPVIEGTNPGIE